MTRYFFDLVGLQSCEYDYRGREFPTPKDAYQLAELIALDFAMEEGNEWEGCTINVRSAEGYEYFSVPLQSSCLAAA